MLKTLNLANEEKLSINDFIPKKEAKSRICESVKKNWKNEREDWYE